MKKTKTDPKRSTADKLRLDKTTVRRLDRDELENVAGGMCKCETCDLTCHG